MRVRGMKRNNVQWDGKVALPAEHHGFTLPRDGTGAGKGSDCDSAESVPSLHRVAANDDWIRSSTERRPICRYPTRSWDRLLGIRSTKNQDSSGKPSTVLLGNKFWGCWCSPFKACHPRTSADARHGPAAAILSYRGCRAWPRVSKTFERLLLFPRLLKTVNVSTLTRKAVRYPAGTLSV